jgi:hypothetical protein
MVVRVRALLLTALTAGLVVGVGCNPRITPIGSFTLAARGDAASDAPADAAPDAEAGASGSSDVDAGTGRYLEAEDGVLSGGFSIGDDGTASGGHFITPNVGTSSDGTEPGPARATYELVAETAGTYLIWGRVQALDTSRNRFWVQVDGGAWTKERITTGNIWWWDVFHDNIAYGTPLTYDFSAGTHELVIANCVDNVELDRLYFAPDRSKPVGNDTHCNPPNSIDVSGVCHPSCGSLGGTHCSTTECAMLGLPTVDVYDCAACCPATLPAN